MEGFKWKIGKWLCEIQDTPKGPLCTCSIQVSTSTIKEWNEFSKKIGKAFKEHHDLTDVENEITGKTIVLAMEYKDRVSTDTMFADAKQRIEKFEHFASEYGIEFEELNNK